MPPAIDATIKRKVIQQWLSGETRTKIAIDNNIGEGTVTGIVNNFKVGLDDSEFDSSRELALHAKKQGLNLSDLSSNFRLHNFIKESGAAEDNIESFIDSINSGDVSAEKIVEYVNQLFAVSREQSIPPNEVSHYIEQKLEQKKEIDEAIQQADGTLQSKNVTVEAIDEHIKLNEKLKEHGLSTEDIYKLLNLLLTARRYGFDGKEIAAKLYNIQDLELKERELKDKCKKLSKRISKYKDVVPLAEDIAAFGIDIYELIALKVGINEAANHYNLPALTATLRLIGDIKKYNRINGLKNELAALCLQKYTLDQVCSRQNEALINLAKLKSYGLTEDRILQLNTFFENNGYKDIKHIR